MEGCLALLLLLLPVTAAADAANSEWYSTTRSLTMGNTGIASAEDSATAMFYNPAALARTKKVSFEFFNTQFDMGTGVFSLGKGGGDIAKNASLEKVKPLLQAKPNTASYLGAALYPNLSAQNFNFGILMRGEGGSYYDGTQLHYKSRYLLIPTMGLSIGSLGGRFRLGVAVRGIQATENDRSVTGIGTGGEGYTVDAQEGFGLGLDAGALISLPWSFLPTLGVVARNVGDTTFSGSAPVGVAAGTVERKEKIKMTYDAGFAIFPKIGRRTTLTMAVDYRDALSQHGIAATRRVNFGMEFNFSRVLYLRAGVGRGYWTAGFGLASRYGSLDMGTYAEELDDTKFRLREDRRFSLRYGSRF